MIHSFKIVAAFLLLLTSISAQCQMVFEFTGNGNFSNNNNWLNGFKPPYSLPGGNEIIINPTNGECKLDVPVTIMPGARLSIAPGKAFRIIGYMNVKQ